MHNSVSLTTQSLDLYLAVAVPPKTKTQDKLHSATGDVLVSTLHTPQLHGIHGNKILVAALRIPLLICCLLYTQTTSSFL